MRMRPAAVMIVALTACADHGEGELARVESAVSAELCNSVDDDEDLRIDEGFDRGESCTSGLGACAVTGTKDCTADQTGTECAPPSYLWCGSFGWPSRIAISLWTEDVALADVDRDGNLDLLTADHGGANGLTVMRGLGNGTFAPGAAYGMSGYPRGVAVGDFNGDGVPDVAVANLYGAQLMRGNGDGTFAYEGLVHTGTSPHAVSLADLNGDGRLDMVAPDQAGSSVGVVLGTGDFTFGAPALFGTDTSPWRADIADYNRDGKLDLGVANANGQSISVLLGNGNGTFRTHVMYDVTPMGGPYDIESADIDRDGDLDLAASGIGGMAILRSNGDGTFQQANHYGGNAFQFEFADWDGDHNLDLVQVGTRDGMISIVAGFGDGTFAPPNDVMYGNSPVAVAVGDIDNNRAPDIAIVYREDSAVAIITGGACAPRPDTESCNGADDDCDGVVDEGNVCNTGGCAPGELDMLDWMTLDEELRGNTRLLSPGHPLYTVVEDDRFWWLKTAQGDTWDLNHYDADYIYFEGTELAFHTPWACKNKENIQNWKAARRCVTLGSPTATIENSNSIFRLVSSADILLTSGNQGTRFEVRDAGNMDWGPGIGVQPTIVIDYNWNCWNGACRRLEQYYLTKRHGLMRWVYFEDGTHTAETTFALDPNPATVPAPMFACDLPPDYEEVSSGSAAANGVSARPSIAYAGSDQLVAFESAASNLVGGDTNNASDILVRRGSSLQRVSVTTAGVPANGASRAPVLSKNGRYVAFESDATNLASKDNNKATDVFVYDLQTFTLIPISVAGAVTANGRSHAPSISGDGCRVAFTSTATNLLPISDTNRVDDVFVRDHCAGWTRRASISNAGAQANGASGQASIDEAGRFVAFISLATNLRPTAPPSPTANLYIYDGYWQTTTGHVYGNALSLQPQFSGGTDSQFIAFLSVASNLVPGDNSGTVDLFLYNRFTNAVTSPSRVANLTGVQNPALSADGRFLAFSADRTGGGRTAYILDRDNGQLVSPRALDGVVTTASPNAGIALATTKRTVAGLAVTDRIALAWVTPAGNIVPGADNGLADVFTRTITVP